MQAAFARFLLLAACVACAPDAGFGAVRPGWRPLFQAPEMRVELDTTSIVRSVHGTDLWLGFETPAPVPVPGDRDGKTFTRSEAHFRVDCKARRARSLHLRLYAGAAATPFSESAFTEGKPEGTWEGFDDSPFGPAVLDSACVALPSAPARDA